MRYLIEYTNGEIKEIIVSAGDVLYMPKTATIISTEETGD